MPWSYVPPGGVIVPPTAGAAVTVSPYCLSVKVAVTLLAMSIVTLQVLPLPEQPDQPLN